MHQSRIIPHDIPLFLRKEHIKQQSNWELARRAGFWLLCFFLMLGGSLFALASLVTLMDIILMLLKYRGT